MRRASKALLLIVAAAGVQACRTSAEHTAASDVAKTQDAAPDGDAAPPERAEVSGFLLEGHEYWPYAEPQPLYPDRVRRRFGDGSAPARRCMAAARAALVAILRDPPAELSALKATRGVAAFSLWNNDYTGAAAGVVAPPRFRGLWLFERRQIKWVGETLQDGRCVAPSRDELARFAARCLEAFPDC